MILRRGSKPSEIACWVSEKAPVMTAWLAMIVASVAMMTTHGRIDSGAMRKNQSAFANAWPWAWAAFSFASAKAPWPR